MDHCERPLVADPVENLPYLAGGAERLARVAAALAERNLAAHVVVGSAHAITEDGLMLAASASGSQFGLYAAAAEQAFWVVGAQQVVPDFDTALRRIRSYSLPLEDARIRAAMPGYFSFIGKILIIEREAFPGRATVILVREPIGF